MYLDLFYLQLWMEMPHSPRIQAIFAQAAIPRQASLWDGGQVSAWSIHNYVICLAYTTYHVVVRSAVGLSLCKDATKTAKICRTIWKPWPDKERVWR